MASIGDPSYNRSPLYTPVRLNTQSEVNKDDVLVCVKDWLGSNFLEGDYENWMALHLAKGGLYNSPLLKLLLVAGYRRLRTCSGLAKQ